MCINPDYIYIFSSIASVSEHQPTSWSSFYFDLQVLTILFPAGLYYCFTRLTDHNIFIILYGVTSVYFAGVMVSVYYLVMDLVPEITWVLEVLWRNTWQTGNGVASFINHIWWFFDVHQAKASLKLFKNCQIYQKDVFKSEKMYTN